MTDPMPTIENILGFPARTNTPDHRKIAERMLGHAKSPARTDAEAMGMLNEAQVHAILALADQVTALAAQLEHIHGDIGALPTSPHFAAGRL